MRKCLVNIVKLIFSIICFFGIGILCSLVFELFGVNLDNPSDKVMIGYQFVISLVLTIIMLLLYFKDLKDDFVDFKKNIGKNIVNIIKIFIMFMIVKYIVSFISAIIRTILGIDSASLVSVNQSTVEEYIKKSPLLMAVSCAILAPLYEETLFRLGFKKVLNKGLLFIVISGFIFGLLHVFPLSEGVTLELGIIQSISYVTMGLYLAYIYNKSNNIFTSIGVHFLNNLISVLVMINFM